MKFSLYQYFCVEHNVGHSEKFMNREYTYSRNGMAKKISRHQQEREKEKNDDIRLELNQTDGYTGTKDTKTGCTGSVM